MKKVQRMLNFYTYKRLFCANCDVIAIIFIPWALQRLVALQATVAGWHLQYVHGA